jgi:transposase
MKASRARYTLEFKQEAVRLVESGQSIAAASRTLGLVEQTLFNWVKAHREGTLKGADSRSKVTAEQMEISRLRADLARVTHRKGYGGPFLLWGFLLSFFLFWSWTCYSAMLKYPETASSMEYPLGLLD